MTPGRLLKWLLRAPVALYSAVLEVIAWGEEDRDAIVMSGFGRSSQWYRNVLAGDPVEVRIGRLRRRSAIRASRAD
jgi:hypothetical protein